MRYKTQKSSITQLDLLGQFLIVFLPFLAIFMAATAAHYFTMHNAEQVGRETGEILNVGLARSAVVNDLAGVVTDLMFLADYVQQQCVDKEGRIDDLRVGELFRIFAGEKRLYDQLRLLDTTGFEIVKQVTGRARASACMILGAYFLVAMLGVSRRTGPCPGADRVQPAAVRFLRGDEQGGIVWVFKTTVSQRRREKHHHQAQDRQKPG